MYKKCKEERRDEGPSWNISNKIFEKYNKLRKNNIKHLLNYIYY